jgi:ATP-binding protein involved in chromosome partitioning
VALAPEPRVPKPARHLVAVASGKGGVGKSTVSVNVAVALAERGATVGLLDADVYGPDIPLMVNLTRREPAREWPLWRRTGFRLEPVERYGIRLMSAGFMLGESQVFPGVAESVELVLRQFLADVDWGNPDYLVIDLPPGTADLQLALVRMVPLTGVLVVVGPQDVAHLDARKVLTMLRDEGTHVVGGVENMSALRCPHCGEEIDLFPRGPAERTIWADGVALLGRVPFDPAIARATGEGRPVVTAEPGAPEAAAFREIAAALAEALEAAGDRGSQ